MVGYIATLVLPPTYEARTQILVGPIDASFTIQRASGNIARTYADLATSEDLLGAIVSEIPALDAEALEDTIRTTASDRTRLVSISLQQPTANLAADAANAIVDRLIQLAGSPNPEGRITIIDVAEAPDEAFGPSVPLVVAMAAGAGLVACVLLLFLWESSSKVVRAREEAIRLAGAPVLAVLNRGKTNAEPLGGSSSLMLLSAHLEASTDAGAAQLVIVGTSEFDTASAWATAHLAATLSATGRKVTVIDAGHGAATRLLTSAIDPEPGPPDAAVGLELANRSRIGLIPFRPGQRSPSDRMSPPERLEGRISLITAESANSGSAGAWIDAVGAAVVVVTQDRTRREDLLRTAAALSLMGAEVTGIVVVKPVGRLGAMFLRRRPPGASPAPALGASPSSAPGVADGNRPRPKV